MKNKLQNRTLFVAALSVYLGLLIVGAPPQVLAQQQTAINKKFNSQEQNSNSDDPSLRLFKIIIEESAKPFSARFSFRVDISEGQPVNFQILTAEGNSRIIKFLKEESAVLKRQNLKKDSSYPFQQGLVREFVINESGLTDNLTYIFSDSSKAKEFAENWKSYFADAKSREIQDTGESSLIDANIKHENNQVFIVSHLPRAALDSRLKASEKAN